MSKFSGVLNKNGREREIKKEEVWIDRHLKIIHIAILKKHEELSFQE